jgi:hypothetical protein
MNLAVKTLATAFTVSVLAAAVSATGCSSATVRVVDDGGTTTSTSDGGSTDSSTTPTSPDCETFCAKASAAKCSGAPSCKADCQKQLTETPGTCKTQVEALIKCSANEGKVTGCDSKGKAQLDGCDAQLVAYAQCLLGGGGTDGGTTDAGKLHCEDLTSGNQTCDTCMDGKCCAEETACLDSPDCIAFYDCLGAGTSQTQCGNDHPKGLSLAQKVTTCQDAGCKTACP